MRVYGRTTDVNGNKTWVEVETDANGLNDYVYITALAQELQLNLGESPFWGDRGIPAHPSVVQQVAPDYYTMLVQKRYAPFFTSLVISKIPESPGVDPTYRVNVTTQYGVSAELHVPI